MNPTKKTKPAIWRKAFPDQAVKLRPENTERGGVKARSGSENRRTEVYNAIKELFLQRPLCCERCKMPLYLVPLDVHHKAGRDGLLLFDVRHFAALCRDCHTWIHAHPAEAKTKGWLE